MKEYTNIKIRQLLEAAKDPIVVLKSISKLSPTALAKKLGLPKLDSIKAALKKAAKANYDTNSLVTSMAPEMAKVIKATRTMPPYNIPEIDYKGVRLYPELDMPSLGSKRPTSVKWKFRIRCPYCNSIHDSPAEAVQLHA